MSPCGVEKSECRADPELGYPHSYRPIYLTSCIGKTAERMVLVRLLWWIEPFHHNMYGFIKRVSAIDCVGTLLGLLGSQPAIVVFLDLRRAFVASKGFCYSCIPVC
ncbi:uncharacterized protein LOC143037051 [Oratosquilla oratoria]|uniref:uncharacterized protein LOC143037051 n=1 Tax=Oratosquilla oratoria TaxID=337810 RepID=UPI003F75F5E4